MSKERQPRLKRDLRSQRRDIVAGYQLVSSVSGYIPCFSPLTANIPLRHHEDDGTKCVDKWSRGWGGLGAHLSI